jgi:hypothetical protein
LKYSEIEFNNEHKKRIEKNKAKIKSKEQHREYLELNKKN